MGSGTPLERQIPPQPPITDIIAEMRKAHRMQSTPQRRNTLRGRLNAIRRTRQMVSDQIDIIDRAAPDAGAQPSEMVVALTGLVKLLESLQRLERCHRNECAQRTIIRRERRDNRKLSDEIARRIDVLCAAREAGGGVRTPVPERAPADERDEAVGSRQ